QGQVLRDLPSAGDPDRPNELAGDLPVAVLWHKGEGVAPFAPPRLALGIGHCHRAVLRYVTGTIVARRYVTGQSLNSYWQGEDGVTMSGSSITNRRNKQCSPS